MLLEPIRTSRLFFEQFSKAPITFNSYLYFIAGYLLLFDTHILLEIIGFIRRCLLLPDTLITSVYGCIHVNDTGSYLLPLYCGYLYEHLGSFLSYSHKFLLPLFPTCISSLAIFSCSIPYTHFFITSVYGHLKVCDTGSYLLPLYCGYLYEQHAFSLNCSVKHLLDFISTYIPIHLLSHV